MQIHDIDVPGDQPIRVAMVGCGAHAYVHLKAMKQCTGRFVIAAAVDQMLDRAEKFLAEAGSSAAPKFKTLKEALDANVQSEGKLFDTIDIIVPHNHHEAVATEALRSGLHIILEKPISTSLESALRILSEGQIAKQKFGKVFMVAENSEYWPDVVHTKKLIDSGAIGTLLFARAVYNEEMPKQGNERFSSQLEPKKAQADSDEISGRINPFGEQKPWRFTRQANGGGVAIDGGAHWIRPLRMLIGELDQVMAYMSRIFEPMEGETLVRAVFLTRDKKISATFDCNMTDTVFAPEPLWLIQGTEGAIAIQREGGVILYTAENRSGKQMCDFADAVQKRTNLKADAEKALGELRCALAIYRSAASGKWEKIWEDN